MGLPGRNFALGTSVWIKTQSKVYGNYISIVVGFSNLENTIHYVSGYQRKSETNLHCRELSHLRFAIDVVQSENDASTGVAACGEAGIFHD